MDAFHRIADDAREEVEARGHRVEQALSLDPAFGTGTSRGALHRELVVDSVARSASQNGVFFEWGRGGACELVTSDGETIRRYRLRRARRSKDGELIVTASEESSLVAEGEDVLMAEEQWVFAWILDSNGLIAEVLVAEVIGYLDGRPGRLMLGRTIPLGTSDPLGPRGFVPTEEELDGWDELGDGQEPASM